MKFSIIIPTYKREKDLDTCLRSIVNNTILPSEVIIIDDDNLSEFFLSRIRNILENKKISFVYHKKDHKINRRGLSESKNIGTNLSSNEIFFILDDDLVLENKFFEEIIKTWKKNNNEKLIGVGGIITNNRKKYWFENIYNKLFLLNSSISWDVNKLAFQSWNDHIKKEEKAHYIHGGACSYKKSVIKKLGYFSTFSGGRTALEDVDFCLRAKINDYHFIIQPKSRTLHNHSPSGRENNYLMGHKEGYNRKIIFKSNNLNNKHINKLSFFWANLGWILRQFLTANFKKGLGMIRGLITK